MFEKNTEKDIQDRLSVLHVLEKYNKPIEKDLLINFFLISKLYNFLEISDIINTLKENNLILEKSNIVALSDNGIVALSFFRDKLPLEKQKVLENLMKNTSLFEEQFHSFIKRHESDLIIKIAKGKKIKLDMKIDSSLIPDMTDNTIDSKELYEDLLETIKKHLIHKEL